MGNNRKLNRPLVVVERHWHFEGCYTAKPLSSSRKRHKNTGFWTQERGIMISTWQFGHGAFGNMEFQHICSVSTSQDGFIQRWIANEFKVKRWKNIVVLMVSRSLSHCYITWQTHCHQRKAMPAVIHRISNLSSWCISALCRENKTFLISDSVTCIEQRNKDALTHVTKMKRNLNFNEPNYSADPTDHQSELEPEYWTAQMKTNNPLSITL